MPLLFVLDCLLAYALGITSRVLPYLCFLLLTSVIASPNQTRTVTSRELVDLDLFSDFSAAAYCASNYALLSDSCVVCPYPACGVLNNSRSTSAEVFGSFRMVDEYKTTGLVMIDHTRQIIVISFRGTHTTNDWLTDLRFLLTHADDICTGCKAHSGFLGSWRGVREGVWNDWLALQTTFTSYKTIVTGHSLGGAIAQLCAAQFKAQYPTLSMSLYTFGSPRVGDSTFATCLEWLFGPENHRATHLNDPIPRLPARALGGYVHAGPEYFIAAPHIANALSADYSTLLAPKNLVVRPSDIQVLIGPESPLGNLGFSCTNFAMHSEYVGPMSGCSEYDLQQSGGWPSKQGSGRL